MLKLAAYVWNVIQNLTQKAFSTNTSFLPSHIAASDFKAY
jgi:hypothetical protein